MALSKEYCVIKSSVSIVEDNPNILQQRLNKISLFSLYIFDDFSSHQATLCNSSFKTSSGIEIITGATFSHEFMIKLSSLQTYNASRHRAMGHSLFSARVQSALKA